MFTDEVNCESEHLISDTLAFAWSQIKVSHTISCALAAHSRDSQFANLISRRQV